MKEACDSAPDSTDISCPPEMLSKVAISQRSKEIIIVSGNCTRMTGSSENGAKLRTIVFGAQSLAKYFFGKRTCSLEKLLTDAVNYLPIKLETQKF